MLKLKSKKAEPEVNQSGIRIITKKYLKDLCFEQGLYCTPNLNDKLYLHFKGFSKIEQLDEYVNLCALYLENNCIRKIEGLDQLKQLRYLYLHNNKITKIEGLEQLENLVVLNLSENHIMKVENLKQLNKLETLNLSSNYLTEAEAIEKIVECPSLTCLDLSSNQINYSDQVLSYFYLMPKLACLYLHGTRAYRRPLIYMLPNLTFLDSTPVSNDERKFVQAWFAGGREAEMEARLQASLEKEEARKSYLKSIDNLFTKISDIRRRELQKFEEELEKKKIILEKDKQRLFNDPKGEAELKKVEEELKIIGKKYQEKEELVDKILAEKTIGINKFQCMIATKNENNESEFLGISNKEYESYLEDQHLLWLLKQPFQNRETLERQQKQEANKDFEETLNKFSSRFTFTNDLSKELLQLLDMKAYDFNRVKQKLNEYISLVSQKRISIQELMKNEEFRKLYTLVQQISLFLNQQANSQPAE